MSSGHVMDAPSERIMSVAMPLLGAAEAAALGAALRLRSEGGSVEPGVAAAIDGVLGVLGLRDAIDRLGEQELVGMLGIVEGFLNQSADFVSNPTREGWNHDDPSVLLAQGFTSTLLAGVFQRYVVPRLGDLEARLQTPGAAVLDVGAGVGALSVALCRAWPQLRVVGVDPWQPALDLGREIVGAAGMADRIELRAHGAESLRDVAEYDLGWVPTFFIPAEVLERVIERVYAALRPGGWALLGVYLRPDDALAAALADLRTARQGGAHATPQELAALMSRSGFVDVDIQFDPESRAPVIFVVGRRAEEHA